MTFFFLFLKHYEQLLLRKKKSKKRWTRYGPINLRSTLTQLSQWKKIAFTKRAGGGGEGSGKTRGEKEQERESVEIEIFDHYWTPFLWLLKIFIAFFALEYFLYTSYLHTS